VVGACRHLQASVREAGTNPGKLVAYTGAKQRHFSNTARSSEDGWVDARIGLVVAFRPGDFVNGDDNRLKSTGRAVLSVLRSVKLGMALLAAIALASAAGTLIRQEPQAQNSVGLYGVLGKLGLTALYSSWWFATLFGLLLLNMVLCVVWRVRGLLRRPGMLLAHLSAVVIGSGVLTGILWGSSGYIILAEGEHTDSFDMQTHNGIVVVPLGFTVGLEDFILERYDSGSTGVVSVREQGSEITDSVAATEGADYDLFDGRYHVEILKIVPDIRISLETREVVSVSSNFNNPAVQIRIRRNGDEETRWLFANRPGLQMSPPELPLETEYRFSRTAYVKDFKSRLWIETGGSRVLTKTIEVNDPLVYNGYHFYQTYYDAERQLWSGFQVVRDPGVPVVYMGFAMLCIGMVIDVYPRVWRLPTHSTEQDKES